MVYGGQTVDKSHMTRAVKLCVGRDEVSDCGDSQSKKFLREVNKVVRGSERNLLYISFI